MSQLIADRFLAIERDLIIDAATSKRVDLALSRAGDKREQQTWVEQCAARLADAGSRLIDFGFIGCDRRFEAVTRQARPLLHRTATIDHVVEWLEQSGHCRPDVFVAAQGHSLMADGSLARELRLRGFVAVSGMLFDDRTLTTEISSHLRGRSVVLLHAHRDGDRLANAVLTTLSAGARHIWAVRNSEPQMANARIEHIAHAAESRVAFGAGASRHIIDDAETFIARGRHALAERNLRASIAAFDRRNDALRAADAEMLLGRLLQTRGRVEAAFELFERARERYQSRHRTSHAIEACLFAGLVQADRGLFAESEHILRTARSAAAAVDDRRLAQSAATGLARALYWQGRLADASMLLETVATESQLADGARFWCLVARIRLAAGDVTNAWPAVARARASLGKDSGPSGESLVRTAEAMVQAKLGDVEALERHVREGLRASAQAHLPLQALRLRLTLIDGLLDAGHTGRARNVARRLAATSKRQLPPLLARHAGRTIDRLAAPAVHETPPAFVAPFVSASLGTSHAANQGEADGLAELLAIFHGVDDEREALTRGASAIRKQLSAIAIGIFSATSSGLVPLAAVGASLQVMAERCASVVQAIAIERAASGYECAVPIRYLGRLIGVLACRWSIDGPSSAQRVNAFCSAAASACGPLVYTVAERQAPSTHEAQPNCEIIGVSRVIDEVRGAVARAANAPFTVLIEGESGSGKELVARAIHRLGCRRERKFCALNCAALPDDLVDTELFGHAKGAFTGAAVDRQGLFESADQGTVFLDEIGELSARAQAKLLRVLQEGEIRRIGETFTRPVDARLVAATNRSLGGEVAAGRFRQDLLYRLDVIRITVPPLRDRPEDIPLLAARFWRQAADQVGCKAVLGPGTLSALARYDWPGNVRELQNVLTSMAVAAPSRGVVGASQLPGAIGRTANAVTAETLDMARFRFEQRFVRATLARTAGHRGRAAAALGVSRQGLAKLLLRLGIE